MSTRKPVRKRSKRFQFWASDEEVSLIQERMEAVGITSTGVYVRKMAVDGYHINVDLSDVKELVSLLRRCSNNLNQLVKRANETRNIYEADIEDLRRQYDTLWDAANKILKGLAKIK